MDAVSDAEHIAANALARLEPVDLDDVRSLASTVVLKALSDATSPVYGHRGSSTDRPTRAEKADAIAFCIAETTHWKADRKFWCEAAGIHPDWIRKHALRELSKQIPGELAA